MSIDNTLFNLMALAALLYLLTWITSFFGRNRLTASLMSMSFVVAFLLLLLNAYAARAWPFGNMRHVLCFFPLALGLIYYIRAKSLKPYASYFALAAALALIGALCMPLQSQWRQMPALQSPWFVPHVTSYVISYGLMFVAFLITLRSFFPKQREGSLLACDEIIRLAFPFMTFGLLSGALWADEAWAAYWSWDIKEVCSLITWLLYIMYLHIAQNALAWRRPLCILAFIALLVTFFVVNLMSGTSSVHSYAQ